MYEMRELKITCASATFNLPFSPATETHEGEDPQQTFGIRYEEELCGIISLHMQKDVYQKSAEIGYWIGEPFWGMGIATKAVEIITAYGFSELQLARIYAGVFDFNKASMSVLEKNGYEQEGIFRNAIFKNNRLCDEHRYGKLNPFS